MLVAITGKKKVTIQSRKALIILTALLAIGSEPAVAQTETRGGTLVIGDSNPPTLINPLLVDSGISVSVAHLVYNRLLRLNAKGEMEPELVQSWSVSDDQLVYTFHLKQGVHFHDGVELTSDDVRFTYETISDPAMRSPYALGMGNVVGYADPGRYEFRIMLKKPQTDFVNDLVVEILPAHLYRGSGLDSHPANRKPVGTGPFKFRKWDADEILLEANDDYFEGRPALDHVVFKTYRNKSEVWSALMRGEVDMARFLRVEDYEQTRKDPSFKTYAVPLPLFYGISYNLNSPVLQDVRVRRAVSCAINRSRMIEALEEGYGLESDGPFQPGYWAYDPDIKKFDYDPARSLQMLKESGWADADGDGILEKEGRPLRIRMLIDGKDSKLRKMAMFMRQDLQEIGVGLEIRLYQDKSEVMKNVKNAEAHLILFYGSSASAHYAVKPWASDDVHKGKAWFDNETGPEIDRLIFLGQTAINQEERRQAYAALQKMLYENQISCFLYFPYIFHAVSRRIQNTDELLGSPFLPDYFIKKLYVDDK